MNDFKQLQAIWYEKLKESGFKDIEYPTSDCLQNNVVSKYRKGVESSISYSVNETKDFYRIIGLYLHQSNEVPDKYKDIIELYVNGYSIPKAISISNSKIAPTSIHSYINRNFKKMMRFVAILDKEAYEDDLIVDLGVH